MAIDEGGTRGGPALEACCEVTAPRLTAVPDVRERYPWLPVDGGGAAVVPGFGYELGWGRVVASPWGRVHEHVIPGHGPRAWEDFLHAAVRPCLVVEQPPKRGLPPRFALYRLREGTEFTFRMAVIEHHGEGRFSLVTAFARHSLTRRHYGALAAGRLSDRCPAFCLRTRDIDPQARPRIDRPAPCVTEIPSADCCENQLACLKQAIVGVDA
ncbi:MAG: hypothetical protein ACLGI2_09615 [Acidimicrobiia bacterium]